MPYAPFAIRHSPLPITITMYYLPWDIYLKKMNKCESKQTI